MNILPIQSTNFCSLRSAVKYYVPGRNDTTLRCFIEGTVEKPTMLKYDILKKGKVVETKEFHNKKGFNAERFAAIVEQTQAKVRDGFDFLYETLNAQLKGGN